MGSVPKDFAALVDTVAELERSRRKLRQLIVSSITLALPSVLVDPPERGAVFSGGTKH